MIENPCIEYFLLQGAVTDLLPTYFDAHILQRDIGFLYTKSTNRISTCGMKDVRRLADPAKSE